MATGSAGSAEPSPPADVDRAAWEAIGPDVRARLADFLSPEDFTVTSGCETAASDWQKLNHALNEAESFEAL
ncbi:hypothetical protein [Streptomyces sp. NPDC058280]|uniref:hypothetical protein n=1 Tax=Streptomyces sp. NPDC058280 TaxID=3346419 RepID=UPI0036E426F3